MSNSHEVDSTEPETNRHILHEVTPIDLTNRENSSVSFNAYPIEYSSKFLRNDDDVIFMPLNPTDVPISILPTLKSAPLFAESAINSSQNPVCHGLFFPFPEQQTAEQVNVETRLPNTRPSIDAISSIQTPSQLCDNAELSFGIMLLQQLIALQIANETPSSAQPVGSYPSPPETSVGIQTSPNIADSNHSERFTYLVPVEATLGNENDLALHIKPRDEHFGIESNENSGGFKLDCPTNQLVLYPYSCQKGNNRVDENNVTVQSDVAQAVSLRQLKTCLRRGSLEIPQENSSDILDMIKGRTKSGFVLLSVQREPISQDDQVSVGTVNHIFPTSQLVKDSTTITITSALQKEAQVSQPAKKNKRRQRFSRSDTDSQRRSSKRNSRQPLKQIQDTGVAQEEVVHPEASLSVSRFRVSRFADKKQAWIAPFGSGCFVVHDLWTTKLPEYVVKNVQAVVNKESCSRECSGQLAYDPSQIYSALGSECMVCQSDQPQPCECGSYART